MNIETVITWYNGKMAGLWYNGRLIWETKEVVAETDLLTTIVALPLIEATRFIMIIINGMTADYLLELLAVLKIEVAKINKLKNEIEANEEAEHLEWRDW